MRSVQCCAVADAVCVVAAVGCVKCLSGLLPAVSSCSVRMAPPVWREVVLQPASVCRGSAGRAAKNCSASTSSTETRTCCSVTSRTGRRPTSRYRCKYIKINKYMLTYHYIITLLYILKEIFTVVYLEFFFPHVAAYM